MSVFKVKDNNNQWVTVSAGGVGVPSGGSTAQVLVKASNADYSTRWSEQVHVGGNPPTDEGVAIWLDTDEAGMSAVSSVNAKTGTVVLDADDVGAMSKWVLLWENASPTSAFSPQTVDVDMTGYDAFAIRVRTATATSFGPPVQLFLCDATLDQSVWTWAGNNANGYRQINYSTTGITFAQGVYNNSYPQNSYVIPTQIWGIKGVITT